MKPYLAFLVLLWSAVLAVACTRTAPSEPEDGELAPKVGASPTIVSFWDAASVYLDPNATVTGTMIDGGTGPCANDSKDCASATCASIGSGPCLTYRAINNRLGCQGYPNECPTWNQPTNLFLLSSQTDQTDLISFYPRLTGNGYLIVQGTPTTVCAGTLSGFVNRVRDAGSPGTLSQSVLCVGAAPNLFVQNTTRSGGAWIKANISGSTWSLSTALANVVPPWNGSDPPEQDNWASGDSYQILSFPSSFVSNVMPANIGGNGAIVADVSLYHVDIAKTGSFSSVNLRKTAVIESRSDALVNIESNSNDMNVSIINSDFQLNMTTQFGSGNVFGPPTFKGGIFNLAYEGAGGVTLEGDAIITTNSVVAIPFQMQNAQINGLYIDNNVEVFTTGYIIASHYPGQGSIDYVWGPGALTAGPASQINFGVGNATTDLVVSHVRIGLEKTTGCSVSDAGAWTCGIPITPQNIDTSVADGGFGEGVFSPTGASIVFPGSAL